jgi:hypothetical protein
MCTVTIFLGQSTSSNEVPTLPSLIVPDWLTLVYGFPTVEEAKSDCYTAVAM